MQDLQETATKIQNLLKEKGTTVNKMLLELNLRKSLVTDMRTGAMPSADKLLKIANYLGVTVNYLLGADEPEQPDKVATPPPDKVAITVIGYGMEQETKYISRKDYDEMKPVLDKLFGRK